MTKQITMLAACAVIVFCVLAAGCTGPTSSPRQTTVASSSARVRNSSATTSSVTPPIAQVITPSASSVSPPPLATSTPSTAPTTPVASGTSTPAAPPYGASASGISVLFFYRPTCPYCQRLEPQMDALQARYSGKVTVQKINDDDPANSGLIDQYRVIVVPTTILLHNGVVVQTWPERLSDTSQISAQIDSLLQTK